MWRPGRNRAIHPALKDGAPSRYVVWAETAHLFTTQEVDRFRAALDRHGGV